jgi:hypothetical protein
VSDAKAFLSEGLWVIAYVVLAQPGLRMSELRQYLTKRLPPAALPACCIPLESLPLSAHGKTSSRREDYPILQAADYRRFEEVFQAPETEVEHQLAAIILRQTEHPLMPHNREAVNVLLDMNALGVDSLGLVGVELEIAEQFQVSDLTEEQLTTWPLYKLALHLEQRREKRSAGR